VGGSSSETHSLTHLEAYSSFIFVGITSALAFGTNAHPQLGSDPSAYWAYYWRGFVDKTDGNYWVICPVANCVSPGSALLCAGGGGFWKRGSYAATRIFVARKYNADNTFNISEVLGRGIAQGISTTYYPSQSNTGEKLAENTPMPWDVTRLPTSSASSGPILLLMSCIAIRSQLSAWLNSSISS